MKVSGSSPFIRWCYLLRLHNPLKDSVPPQESSVCELFARAFLGTPFALLFVGAVFVIGGPIYGICKGWHWLSNRYGLERDINLPDSMRVVSQRLEDWHDRVCTKVEIE